MKAYELEAARPWKERHPPTSIWSLVHPARDSACDALDLDRNSGHERLP